MPFMRKLIAAVCALFRKTQIEQEMDEELRAYLDAAAQEKMRAGMNREQARRAARVEMGSVDGVKEAIRSAGWESVIETLWQDVRYGARQLKRNPGFRIVAAITLALGIGVNTTIFSLADALLLRPFPVADSGRLVYLLRQMEEQRDYYSSFSHPEYQDFREQTKAFAGVAASSTISVSMSLQGEARRINGEIVSGNYFTVLGVKTALGRTFLPEEDQAAGGAPVMVLSDNFWRQYLNADPAVIGKPLLLYGHSFTVVGVAPSGFRGLSVGTSPAFWVPLATHDQVMPTFTFEGHSLFDARGCDWLDVVGRLQPGERVGAAQAEARLFAEREAAAYPQDRKGWTLAASPLNESRLMPWNGDITGLMGLLAAVVGLVLLIACANVAGLLTARAAARRAEIGIRTALGAGRVRVLRQLLTEGLLLSALGGAGALLLAPLAIHLLASFELPGIDMAALDLRLDWRVLGFTLMLALITTLVFGTMPAWQAAKVDVAETLKGVAHTTGTHRPVLRQALVVTQIALSLLLLVGAGLLLRTFRNLLGISLGFDSRNVLLLTVELGSEGYTEARAHQFYQQVLQRVAASPGIRSASWAATAPLSGRHIADDLVLDGGKEGREQRINSDLNWVTPEFFSTFGIPFVSGRGFLPQDREGAPRVAVVSESAARRFWPGESPIGQRFWMHDRSRQPGVEVIGVVKDGKYYNRVKKDVSRPFIFLAFDQAMQPEGTLLVKGQVPVTSLTGAIREQVRAVAPSLPILDVKTFQQQFQDGLALERIRAALVGAFGALALALAAVGIFGLVSFSVGQRTHEFGLRMALGARRRNVIALVLRQGLMLTAVGVGVGLVGAAALTRLVRSQLYDVTPTDPLTLALATAGLEGVALLACYIPARRATKVDPMVALRYE